jgi:hypothetical protein
MLQLKHMDNVSEKRNTYTWNDDIRRLAEKVGKDIRESERRGFSWEE